MYMKRKVFYDLSLKNVKIIQYLIFKLDLHRIITAIMAAKRDLMLIMLGIIKVIVKSQSKMKVSNLLVFFNESCIELNATFISQRT